MPSRPFQTVIWEFHLLIRDGVKTDYCCTTTCLGNQVQGLLNPEIQSAYNGALELFLKSISNSRGGALSVLLFACS